MDATGTTELSDRSFDTLSGGEKQMVSIASVLAQGAGILLLDEPAAYLDPNHSRRINDLIESLRVGMGITVVSVTHDLNDALLGVGTLLLLGSGRVIYTGDAGAALAEGMLEKLYGRDFEYSVHPSTGSMFVLPDAGRRP